MSACGRKIGGGPDSSTWTDPAGWSVTVPVVDASHPLGSGVPPGDGDVGGVEEAEGTTVAVGDVSATDGVEVVGTAAFADAGVEPVAVGAPLHPASMITSTHHESDRALALPCID